jgi:tetratricopeptide (TPR) repeat protein
MRLIIFITILFIGLTGLSGIPVEATGGSARDFFGQEKGKKGKEKNEIKPANPSLMIDAKKEAMIGNLKSAAEKFRNIIDRFPDDPVPYYELARVYVQMNNAEDALENGRIAFNLNPENEWFAIFLAELCYNTGRYDEATSLYEKIVTLKPGNTDFLFQLAELYMQSEKYREAIGIYDRIEEKAGINEEMVIQKQKIYLHLNEPKNAEKELKKLITVFPGESRYYSILAEYYLSQNMRDEALAMYKKVTEIDPENAYIHMSLADFYRKAGDNQKAYEELQLGFATPNLDVDTKVNILLSFYTVNQIYNELKEQAFTLAGILIKTHPNDPKVYSIYGDLLLQDKQYPAARDAFLKVIAIDSSRYAVWEQLLRLYLQLSEYEPLVEYGNRTIELFPEQPLPFLFTGVAYMQLKRYDEALKILKTGENLVVDNSDIQSQFCMYQGDIYHAQNRNQEAFQAYEKSLALNYDNPYVLNNYAYYLSLEGKDLEKALKMSKRATELDSLNASFQDTHGWVLYMKGRYQEAAVWIEKAVNSDESPSGEVLEHFGDVLFKLNDVQRAEEYWNKALQKGGGSDQLRNKIDNLKMSPGVPKK